MKRLYDPQATRSNGSQRLTREDNCGTGYRKNKSPGRPHFELHPTSRNRIPSRCLLGFNRSIAEKLRDDLMSALENDDSKLPIIMTLHSYALKLMKRFRIAPELGNTTFPSEAELPHVDKVIAKYLRKRDFDYDGKKASIIAVNDLWPLFARYRWYGQELVVTELVEPLKEFNEAVDFSKKFFGINFLGELPGSCGSYWLRSPRLGSNCFRK